MYNIQQQTNTCKIKRTKPTSGKLCLRFLKCSKLINTSRCKRQQLVNKVKSVSTGLSVHEFFDFIGKMIAGISCSILLRWSENSTLLIAHDMSNQYNIEKSNWSLRNTINHPMAHDLISSSGNKKCGRYSGEQKNHAVLLVALKRLIGWRGWETYTYFEGVSKLVNVIDSGIDADNVKSFTLSYNQVILCFLVLSRLVLLCLLVLLNLPCWGLCCSSAGCGCAESLKNNTFSMTEIRTTGVFQVYIIEDLIISRIRTRIWNRVHQRAKTEREDATPNTTGHGHWGCEKQRTVFEVFSNSNSNNSSTVAQIDCFGEESIWVKLPHVLIF